jgi:methylaspartate ammonia-lyase
METEKINAVEVYNKTTNIKVFTDAASGALNLIKNQEASILFSSKKATHCRTKQHYNWQYHNCADKIINLSEVIIRNKMLKYLRSIN